MSNGGEGFGKGLQDAEDERRGVKGDWARLRRVCFCVAPGCNGSGSGRCFNEGLLDEEDGEDEACEDDCICFWLWKWGEGSRGARGE